MDEDEAGFVLVGPVIRRHSTIGCLSLWLHNSTPEPILGKENLRGMLDLIVGDCIVVLGNNVDSLLLCRSSDDIQADFFLWRRETSSDRGMTWRIEQEMFLKRPVKSP